VLVVDDEPGNLAIATQLLKDRYALRVANGGRRALELAASWVPDLVLLDIDMPDMDGYATCEQLKRSPALADVPVIFLTARSTIEDEARGFDVGAVDYIHKPISPPVLQARVRTQLALRQALSEAREQQRKADAMLEVVLPRAAADELRRTTTVQPRRIEGAVVLFGDIVGFTSWCQDEAPEDVVAALHRLFLEFESIAHDHGVEKLKTIGDGFMAGAGLLLPAPDPLMSAIRCGLAMARATPRLVPSWQLRVGVHCGPVVAGIVGGERYQFDIWGDTVNTAARLTSVSTPGTVAITFETWQRLEPRLKVVDAGRRNLKGKGEVHVIEVLDVLG
jgi:class 3 adenylate cyclase